MSRYHLSTLAQLDLDEIYGYIAKDRVEAAIRMMGRFEATFKVLSDGPLLGELRADLQAEVRMFSIGNYAIFYRPLVDGVQIVRVAHSARDFGKLFPEV